MSLVTALQRRRFGVATAVLCPVLGLAACSGAGARHTAAPMPSASASTPTTKSATAPVVDRAAATALAGAIAASRRLRSYNFRSSQKLTGGSREQVSGITGRAVRPSSLAYVLRTGASSQEIIKIGQRTYLRVPPAPYKVLAKATAAVDPLASLLTLLGSVRDPHLAGSSLTGNVPATDLAKAKLAPAGAASGATVPVTFTLDAARHVSSLNLAFSVQAGSKTLVLVESTAFSGFDQAPAIKVPTGPRG